MDRVLPAVADDYPWCDYGYHPYVVRRRGNGRREDYTSLIPARYSLAMRSCLGPRQDALT